MGYNETYERNTMNAKQKKIRSWMKDHSFEIGVTALFVSLFAAVTVLSIKEAEAIADELEKQNAWQKQQIEDGNTIVEEDDHLYAVKIVSMY